MHVYTEILGFVIPSYGLMISFGVILANLIACYIVKRHELSIDDFIILESYCMLGAMIGAKLLYLLVSFRLIDWHRILEPTYFDQLMKGGFVFYGGLIGGLLFVFGGARIHHITASFYIRRFVFLIPFIHGFGRIGCFMAGCCYGVPYHGVGAVVFPEGSFAVPGIELFPVQIVEAVGLFAIAGALLFMQRRENLQYTIEYYFISYGILRFFLEYLRYDAVRGSVGPLSTSQIISCILICAAVCEIIFRHSNPRKVDFYKKN